MSEELKPCPFCGGKNLYRHKDSDGLGQTWVWCADCGASGPVKEERSHAIEAWNRRTNE